MDWYVWLIVAIVAVLVVFLAVIIGRTLAFRPKKEETYPDFPVHCDGTMQDGIRYGREQRRREGI